ncbi:hypothetical protein DFH06DRAFT_1193644 [Mycena polygramma]|nr:hypothetical protein DFH06DRAFT_1240030 [Mycena polygramma]KAJ7623894.1 hypothetical protein DFH06DRAFT_1230556 [Mycena polygramma]KAJ7660938.1 hypothetical protein DFH06DRAFT_1193644 [Mycena polygramma]
MRAVISGIYLRVSSPHLHALLLTVYLLHFMPKPRVTQSKSVKKTPKKKIRYKGHINPPIGWRFDLRLGARRNPRTGSPALVKIEMTSPGLKLDDPLILSDDEEDDDIVVLDQPSASHSSSTSTQPSISSVFASVGSRLSRPVPLQASDLLVGGVTNTGDRSCEPKHEALKCGICWDLKSHTVVLLCGHTFCYVCIRLNLEHSFKCPLCNFVIKQAPQWVVDFDGIINTTYPSKPDKTSVNWETAWAGLTFPTCKSLSIYIDH